MLKKTAIILNIIVFGWILFLFIDELRFGFEGLAGWDILLFSLLLLTPIVNILALVLHKDKDGWITLYFKRKAMEEKRKILELTDKTK